MGLNLIAAVVAAILALFSLLYYKHARAKREVERLAQKVAQVEQEKRELKDELKTKQTEVKNAKIAKNNAQTVGRSSDSAVDKQLHEHNYFRDGDRVRGFRANLPQPDGYGGDQTPSAHSQSDL